MGPTGAYLHLVLDVIPYAQHHNPEHRLRQRKRSGGERVWRGRGGERWRQRGHSQGKVEEKKKSRTLTYQVIVAGHRGEVTQLPAVIQIHLFSYLKHNILFLLLTH